MHMPIVYKFQEQEPPGNLRACPGLYRVALVLDFVNVKIIRPWNEIFNMFFSYVSYKIRSHGAKFRNNITYCIKIISWELFAIEYPQSPALEQNLCRQRLKDYREEKTFVKRLLIQQITDFDDKGIQRETSPTVKRFIPSGSVWRIGGVTVELNLNCSYWCWGYGPNCTHCKIAKTTFSFVMSVRPSSRLSAWNNSASTGRIFMKFDIWVFF